MIETNEEYGYVLTCPLCGRRYNDDGILLFCDSCLNQGFKPILKFTPNFNVHPSSSKGDILRFKKFFPCNNLEHGNVNLLRTISGRKFSQISGLKNLYFTITGFSKNLGLDAMTCSFKELEALSVINRLKSHHITRPLVVASAGNTARAFSYYAAKLEYPVVIVAPRSSQRFLWLPDEEGLYERVQDFVTLILLDQQLTYQDASRLAKKICRIMDGSFIEEGGFFNVGRLSGLGCCALDFASEVGCPPDHYIQAAGSGAGVLASLRAYELLYGERFRHINVHIVQNIPYIPLVKSIEEKNDVFSTEHFKDTQSVCSPMLTSCDAAYGYPGGILEYIKGGTTCYGYGATNREIYDMHHIIWKEEKLFVLLPAAAALIGLVKAVEQNRIKPDETVQVNITGLGDVECMSSKGFFYLNFAVEPPVPKEACDSEGGFLDWFNRNLIIFRRLIDLQ